MGAYSPPAVAQAPSVCLGDATAAGVPQKPGPLLRFGITPAGEAGALGPMVPAVPDQPERTLAALAHLRPSGGRPFVLRLNRFFWSDGEAGIQKFLALTKRYTDAGYLVELQVRYHPRPDQEGDIEAWKAHVREIVRRFGPNRRVVALQITNEVNFTVSPDSSDGAYRNARDALVQGVIAAKDEATQRGYANLEIGFNWFYRTDPDTEATFWNHLRDKGGPAFVRAVDWVGLDAYPGTFFPPAESPGGERDGLVSALSQLRKCFMPIPGIPDRIPIKVEETGYPTGAGRSYEKQAEVLQLLVQTAHDFRGTYNVTDFRWFDLRDHATSSSNFQHQYGLLRDDYTPKPAFGLYRALLGSLAGTGPAISAPLPGPRLRLRYLHGPNRCVRTAIVMRVESGVPVRVVRFSQNGRSIAVDRRAPFRQTVRLPRLRGRVGPRVKLVAIVIPVADGARTRTFTHTVRMCPAPRRA